ncbi:MAG: hypothetical protein AMJ54_12800 [Deltaproteobacteria bacterium SG8_13]|nr:MAG: hypothetical protein AMJ54_12800 [Deltaproteobacteria bacterium SG8_13]
MTRQARAIACFIVLLLTALMLRPPGCRAAVVVFDRVTGVGRPVFLKAVTRGLIFTKGGRRVAIRIDGGPPVETLSGADGAAFLKYHPDKPGLRTVTAVSEGEEGSGTLLVLEPDEAVIVIGIEGGLQKGLFPEEKRRATREVLSSLSRTYRLVYLTRWIGVGLVKTLLAKHQFPQSVVLSWRGESVFKQMENSGVRVAAVIGSASLLQAAPDSIENRFTFDENHASAIGSWEEICKALQDGSEKADRPSCGKNPSRPEP